MANELKSAILCFIAILAFHPAPVPQRPRSHFHSILRLPSCPNLLSPISPTATLCHGVGKCGSADSDSYTAIFHATPATAASKGKTSCPKQAKSLKPKIFCHCLWWLKGGGRGYWGWIGERGLELSWRCVCRLQALLPHHCPSTCAYVINGVWVLRLTCKGRVVKAKWKWLRALPYKGVTPIYYIFLSFAKKPI